MHISPPGRVVESMMMTTNAVGQGGAVSVCICLLVKWREAGIQLEFSITTVHLTTDLSLFYMKRIGKASICNLHYVCIILLHYYAPHCMYLNILHLNYLRE